MKITSVEAELFHAEGRAGGRKDRHGEAVTLAKTIKFQA